MSAGYKKRFYSYMTAAFTVDQNLDMVTKGLSANALVSFYNYSYAATNRYMTPYYFRVDDDWVMNDDGTFNYTSSTIGTEGNTYLTSSVGHSGYHEWSLQASVKYSRKFGKHDVGADFVYHMKEKVNNATGSSEEQAPALPRAGSGGSRHLQLRPPLLHRGQLRLQRFGELRFGQALRILPLGGFGLERLEREVLRAAERGGEQLQDPRIVRSGG